MAKFDVEGKDTSQLLIEYKKTGEIALRNAIVEKNMRLAEGIAARYTGKGVDYEDLLQVACVALIGAIERFDPSRGFKFSTFAAPTMIGEIKNYFRDKTRMMHISRRDSEQLLAYNDAREKLEKEGPVRTKDVAALLNVSEERVLELMEMKRSISVTSLERVLGDTENDGMLRDVLGREDSNFENIITNDLLEKAIGILNDIDKSILHQRFWRRRSQSEVAQDLGVSQMYISRAERRIIAMLRESIDDKEVDE